MRASADCSSPVSHSSMRSRSAAGGNRAATASGSEFWFNVAPAPMGSAHRQLERLIQVGEDVIDVLDAHAQAYTAGSHSRGRLLLCGHLPMRRRCRMAGERFRVAQIHEALEELQCIVEAHAGLQAAADLEGHERTGLAAEVLLHQGM